MTHVLTTDRLVLRRFVRSDLERFATYRSDPDVARYQGWEAPYRAADAERFFDSQRGAALLAPGTWRQLAVCDRATGVLLGDCAIHPLADQPATAELGVTIAPDSAGRGLATEAGRAVVSWLFASERLHRVYAQTDERNEPARRLLERLGLRLEARLVEADFFKGEWTTLLVYGVLAREWEPDAVDPSTGRIGGSSDGR